MVPEGATSVGAAGAVNVTSNCFDALQGPSPAAFRARTHQVWVPAARVTFGVMEQEEPEHTDAAVYHCWMTFPEGPFTQSW
jgi:hypothetical protein